MIQAEAQHRDHAIVEQVFADLTSGPLAHLPSGHFPANAAWLALAAICHNLTRAAAAWPRLLRESRGATIRGQLIAVAAASPVTAAATSPCTCPKAGTARPHG